MAHISIKDAEPDMELGEDVTDRSGRVLLRAGTSLSEKSIKVLKTWGITHITIAGEDSNTPYQEIIAAHPELLEQANEMAAIRFKLVDKDHPLFKALIESWLELYIKDKALNDA